MIDKTIARIESQKQVFVERLMDLLRIPSISTDPDRKADIQRGAQWVHENFLSAGIKSEIVPTAGHPAVLADSGPVENAPTVLVYGHYDVQPVGIESLWKSEPFDPEVRDGAVFARAFQQEKDIAQALQLYQRNRLQRTARIVNESSANRQMFHLPSVEALRQAFASRDLNAERNEWLFSYDPTTVKLT